MNSSYSDIESETEWEKMEQARRDYEAEVEANQWEAMRQIELESRLTPRDRMNEQTLRQEQANALSALFPLHLLFPLDGCRESFQIFAVFRHDGRVEGVAMNEMFYIHLDSPTHFRKRLKERVSLRHFEHFDSVYIPVYRANITSMKRDENIDDAHRLHWIQTKEIVRLILDSVDERREREGGTGEVTSIGWRERRTELFEYYMKLNTNDEIESRMKCLSSCLSHLTSNGGKGEDSSDTKDWNACKKVYEELKTEMERLFQAYQSLMPMSLIYWDLLREYVYKWDGERISKNRYDLSSCFMQKEE